MAADTHATTQAPGGAHEVVFPPFDTSHFTSQLFWLAVLFGLLYILMSKVALPRVSGILDDRAKRIAADLNAARAAQAHAAEAQKAHEKTVADARAVAQKTAQDARAAMSAQADTERKTLEMALAAKMQAADAQIAAGKASAMTNVSAIATEAAAMIVQQLTGRAPERAVIDAAIASERL